jgi:hypothetical protein
MTESTAKLEFGGKTLELKARSGSVGPDVIDISTLYRDTGAFTDAPDWAANEFIVPLALAGAGQALFSTATMRYAVHGATLQDGPSRGIVFNVARTFALVGTAAGVVVIAVVGGFVLAPGRPVDCIASPAMT